MLTVGDLLLPRLVTIPIERAQAPVQKETERIKAELEQILNDYQKTTLTLKK